MMADSSLSSKIESARKLLSKARGDPVNAFVGFDGFVDSIVRVVDRRLDPDTYTTVSNLDTFAKRVSSVPDGSMTLELVVDEVKIGGNGPLTAHALGRLGAQIVYVGAVGDGEVHPAFQCLKVYGDVFGVAAPGSTDAVEFDDGKIKFCKVGDMQAVDWERVSAALESEDGVRRRLASCDFVVLTNWSMLPCSRPIYQRLNTLAAETAPGHPAFLFFDLGDTEKHSGEDVADIAQTLGTFTTDTRNVVLSLNLKEATALAAAFGTTVVCGEHDAEDVRGLASVIVQHTGIPEVVIHTRRLAVCSTASETFSMDGPYTTNPQISTGGGDHFNAGYCYARSKDVDPEAALLIGNGCSGYYVRTGHPPTLDELDGFLQSWAA